MDGKMRLGMERKCKIFKLGAEWSLMSILVFIDAQVAVETILIYSTSIWLSLPFSCSGSQCIVLRFLAVLSVLG